MKDGLILNRVEQEMCISQQRVHASGGSILLQLFGLEVGTKQFTPPVVLRVHSSDGMDLPYAPAG